MARKTEKFQKFLDGLVAEDGNIVWTDVQLLSREVTMVRLFRIGRGISPESIKAKMEAAGLDTTKYIVSGDCYEHITIRELSFGLGPTLVKSAKGNLFLVYNDEAYPVEDGGSNAAKAGSYIRMDQAKAEGGVVAALAAAAEKYLGKTRLAVSWRGVMNSLGHRDNIAPAWKPMAASKLGPVEIVEALY